MIEFKTTWLPQILRYCEFVTSDAEVKKAWIEHDYSNTSIRDYDEFYVQIFDDLDSNAFLENLSNFLPESQKRQAVADFLLSIKKLDVELDATLKKKDFETLLASKQWQDLKDVAYKLLTEFPGVARLWK